MKQLLFVIDDCLYSTFELMKREIERFPQFPNANKDIIDKLTSLCFKMDTVKPVDLIFVFGSNICHEKLAKHIETLLHNNLAKQLLITGGIADYQNTSFLNTAESEMILSYIQRDNYTDVEIFLETKSKSNLENVYNASSILQFSKIKSVITVSHSYASSRSIQTLKNVFKGEILGSPFDVEMDGICLTSHNWWFTEKGKSLVWGEFLRIKKYGQRGDFELTDEMKSLISEIDYLIF